MEEVLLGAVGYVKMLGGYKTAGDEIDQ